MRRRTAGPRNCAHHDEPVSCWEPIPNKEKNEKPNSSSRPQTRPDAHHRPHRRDHRRRFRGGRPRAGRCDGGTGLRRHRCADHQPATFRHLRALHGRSCVVCSGQRRIRRHLHARLSRRDVRLCEHVRPEGCCGCCRRHLCRDVVELPLHAGRLCGHAHERPRRSALPGSVHDDDHRRGGHLHRRQRRDVRRSDARWGHQRRR